MILPEKSIEQCLIISSIKTNNIIVDAVAGSGKTTTILHISREYPNKNILLLTYNKRLKLETKRKIKLLDLKNIEACSYHSFAVRYYGSKCHNDFGIIELIKKELTTYKKFNYDIIILDESQDISKLYYEFICKIILNNNKDFKICLLGDQYQSIFKFNGADERFIIYGDKLFNLNINTWDLLNLSISYRITNQMADFINNCLLGYKRLNSIKNNERVRYIICDCFSDEYLINQKNRPLEELLFYLNLYNYNDIFILAPSVKSSKSPIRILANIISEMGIPIFVPNNDDEELDEDILKGKIVFSTFHQVKGLERKVVIIFNFDDSYIKYYNKDCDCIKCPNEIYVSLTRASECLTLLHHYSNNYLPFLNTKILKKYVYFENNENIYIKKSKELKNKEMNVYVTDITKHLPSEILDNAIKYLEIKLIHKKINHINITAKTKQGELYENVSEITGTAIPAYYEFMMRKKMAIFNILKKNEIIDTNIINLKNINIPKLLELSNIYCSFISGYIYKVNQIIEYNWIDYSQFLDCLTRLKNYISNNANFEIRMIDTEYILNKKIYGSIDCIDNNIVWEFKCVNDLEYEHFIQLAIYAYLLEKNMIAENNRKYRYLLFNILNNEIYEISFDFNKLKNMVYYLVDSKFGKKNLMTDNQFIYEMSQIKRKYINELDLLNKKIINTDKNYKIYNKDYTLINIELTNNSYYNMINEFNKICSYEKENHYENQDENDYLFI